MADEWPSSAQWIGPETAVIWGQDGPNGTTLLWHAGYRMGLHGGTFSGPLTAQPPLVFTSDGSIVAVQPVPRG